MGCLSEPPCIPSSADPRTPPGAASDSLRCPPGTTQVSIEGRPTMAELDTKTRRKLADEGKALPDGSFPIRNREDLQDAIQSYGRANDKGEAKRWIKRRARELHAEHDLPKDW